MSLFSGSCVGAARIGERRGGGFQPIEVADARFVGDRQHENFAAFFAAADGEDPHAGVRPRDARQ